MLGLLLEFAVSREVTESMTNLRLVNRSVLRSPLWFVDRLVKTSSVNTCFLPALDMAEVQEEGVVTFTVSSRTN